MNAARTALRWILVAFFAAAGFNHFRDPALYLGMMPPWLPWPDLLQRIAGIAEMAGAVGLALPPLRRAAGVGLILLLIAIFPANLHVAMQGQMPGFDLPPIVLWLRLPFQLVFIAAVWWVALDRRGGVEAGSGRSR
ncbi:MAG TPA: DoxX family protein [Opitutaceae bacterium]